MLRKLDAVFFTFSAFTSLWLAFLLLREGAHPGWPMLLLVIFWVFVAYLLLPRLHRILTRLYVPGYFIGRARTSDGLLGDPVNLALLGDEPQLHRVMAAAGWIRADDIDLRSSSRIVTSTVTRRSYPRAPVSPLHLFHRQQDFAYQQEVAGNPAKRHHVRFWRCPEGWMLPGGHQVDWLAAGTYDRSVGFSLFTMQITHKIDQNTDVERDFIVESALAADPCVTVDVIKNFSTGYHTRNGGGDLIETDGDLPILDLQAVDAPTEVAQVATDSRRRRPAQTTFGAGVACLRGLIYAVVVVTLLTTPGVFKDLTTAAGGSFTDKELKTLIIYTVGVLTFGAVIDIGLGLAVFAGRNWARVVLMSVCVFTTSLTFVANVQGRETTTIASLPTIGSSVLVLLALSSHRARDYATSRLGSTG